MPQESAVAMVSERMCLLLLYVGRHCMRMMGSGSAGKEYGKDTGHVIFR
jgi:hypothetical protein